MQKAYRDNLIEPTAGFKAKVMAGVTQYERRRDAVIKRWVVILAATPFVLRQIWLLVRHDYFSASSMPFSELLINTYHAFLTPLAMYGFMGLAIVGVLVAFVPRQKMVERSYYY